MNNEILQKAIDEKNLSIQEVAELTGLTRSAVYQHLSGMGFNLKTAMKYAEVLGIKVEDLTS